MFKKLFGKGSSKKILRSTEKQSTEVKKYAVPDSDKFIFVKFDTYIDPEDRDFEYIRGFHTIPVNEDTSFEEAVSKSISFSENPEQCEKKLLEHMSLNNPDKGTIGSTYKYEFEDGSLLTTISTYKENDSLSHRG